MKRHTYHAGGWLPEGVRVHSWQRHDQGDDFVIPWRGVLQMPGNGHCIRNGTDHPFPNGFGPHFAVVWVDDGPFGGHAWYIGHCTSLVTPHRHLPFGTSVARADQGKDFEGTKGGWVELGIQQADGTLGPNSHGAPHWFSPLLRRDLVR